MRNRMEPLLLFLLYVLLDPSVVVAECPSVCTYDFSPVCGSDFKTYPNKCNLDVQKCQSDTTLRILFDGKCECRQDVACTRESDPHCGTDGKEYGNRCTFAAAMFCSKTGLELAHVGECGSPAVVAAAECPSVCTFDFSPVCGSDFKTYPNKCNLDVQKCQSDTSLRILFGGKCECRQDIACTREYDPHCGTDGKTYGNRCTFAAAMFCNTTGLDLAHVGKCGSPAVVAAAECPSVCTLDFSPVCGSDFKTYPNKCNLDVQKCQSDTSLRILFGGKCECRQDIACTREYDPHCGTDGKTYGNRCTFAAAMFCNTTGLDLAHVGKCGSPAVVAAAECPSVCTLDFSPVCGSDFKTYANKCNLDVQKCQSDRSLRTLFDGKCECREDIACTREYDPHCGTDGKTYGNRCTFAAAKFCSTTGLDLAHVGECGSAAAAALCPDVCTADYSPVCGTDFKTYSNMCELNVKQCKSNPSLSKLFDGECKCREDMVCTQEYLPHCGTDGKTYDNSCNFAAAKLCSTEGLELANVGECENNAGAVQQLAAALVAATLIAVAINY